MINFYILMGIGDKKIIYISLIKIKYIKMSIPNLKVSKEKDK